MRYENLSGLNVIDYEYPGEKVAMAVLKKIPILDILIAKYIDFQNQFSTLAESLGNHFRITAKTNPRVYKLYQLALERLDMKEEFPLFSLSSYGYNAYVSGVKEPFIVIHSSCISNYSDGELLNIIGHEIGHIKSDHRLYYGMADMLNLLLASLGGLAQGVAVTLQYSILDWKRKAEYTADRAGLIATANFDAAVTETLKMLGHSDQIADINFSLENALKQCEDFEMDTSDIIGKLLYVNFTLGASHPWTILRLKQISEWYYSGEYTAIIAKYS